MAEQPEIFRKMKDILKLAAYMASVQCNCKAEGKQQEIICIFHAERNTVNEQAHSQLDNPQTTEY